jgi:tRNA(adenine34) deaminase
MKLALEEAQRAFENGDVPVGAIVVNQGSVIGRGANESNVAESSPFAHAEMNAIWEACAAMNSRRLDKCSIYVTLEPCPMCAGAIVQARVRRVVYGASDPKAGAAGSLYDILRDPRMPHRCSVTAGILSLECADLLKKFFLFKRNGAHRRN